MTQLKKRLKTQRQITAVIINKVSLFQNEIISVKVSNTKTDVFIATVLGVLTTCSHEHDEALYKYTFTFTLPISLKFINIYGYLCKVFYL